MVGLVGGHLKTSIISFLSFFLSSCFLFFFLLHKFWSSWAIEERERERSWVWCGVDSSLFLMGKGVRVTSMFLPLLSLDVRFSL